MGEYGTDETNFLSRAQGSIYQKKKKRERTNDLHQVLAWCVKQQPHRDVYNLIPGDVSMLNYTAKEN